MRDLKDMQGRKVALDIGNVLCHVDIVGDFFNYLVEQNIMETVEQADEFISGIQYGQDLGLYNIRQGFYKFNPHMSKKTLQNIHDKWLELVIPCEETLNVLGEVLDKGYEVALLSNIGKDHCAVVRQKCKVFERCIQHFSCEIGARKPSKLFYQSFLLQHDWPKNVMFLDDRQENIDAAKDYFFGIRFDIDDYESDSQAAAVLRKYLGLS
jgi:FMN phosphatase YigB (HAD superfamily)